MTYRIDRITACRCGRHANVRLAAGDGTRMTVRVPRAVGKAILAAVSGHRQVDALGFEMAAGSLKAAGIQPRALLLRREGEVTHTRLELSGPDGLIYLSTPPATGLLAAARLNLSLIEDDGRGSDAVATTEIPEVYHELLTTLGFGQAH